MVCKRPVDRMLTRLRIASREWERSDLLQCTAIDRPQVTSRMPLDGDVPATGVAFRHDMRPAAILTDGSAAPPDPAAAGLA